MARPPSAYDTASQAISPISTVPHLRRNTRQVPQSARATDSWVPLALSLSHQRMDSAHSVTSSSELLRSAGPRPPGGETPLGTSWTRTPLSATAYSASSWHGPRSAMPVVDEDWESALAPATSVCAPVQDLSITVRTQASALNKIGPMTPATPRYSVPSASLRRTISRSPVDSSPTSSQDQLRVVYHTFVPFWRALTGVVGAVLLTCVIHSLGSGLAGVIQVQGGVFLVSTAGAADVILGVSGWCAGDQCRPYRDQDFTSPSGSLKIPGSNKLSTLVVLMAAHLSLLWLKAAFDLTTAFLHFFLLSSLSLPLSYLAKIPAAERVAAEIELQVRCSRPPNDGMGWVWYADWAHRRGPVGPIFGVVNGVLATATLGGVVSFMKEIQGIAKEGGVKLGIGAIVVIVIFVLNLEGFISSLAFWTISPAHKLSLFSNPPMPNPAALFLPNGGADGATKALVEDRGSFFPVRQTQAFPRGSQSPPMPDMPALDPETRRWLAAYPSDPELVPLISSLRSGQTNDDFLLSDIGLLYLRAADPDKQALLIPPRGEIRSELVQDAHFQAEDSTDAHAGPQAMLAAIGETFWWPGVDDDVEKFASRCRSCVEQRVWEAQITAGMPPTAVLTTAAAPTTGRSRGNIMAAEAAMAATRAAEEKAMQL